MKTWPGNKHYDLYARAWEWQYEMPIFDTDYDNTSKPEPPESAVQNDWVADGTWNTPGTSQDGSPENFSPTDGLCDGTEKFSHEEPIAKMSWEQRNLTPTNPRSTR